MANTTIKKKKEIEKILSKYRANIAALEKKRDSVVIKFLSVLEQRQIEELRKSLQ